MVSRRRPIAVAALVVMAACSTGGNGDERAARFARSSTTVPATVATTTTTTLPVATSPACPTVPPRAQPDPARPRYTVRADVRPASGVVEGEVRVRFAPDLDTDRLVFRLWPNGPRASVGGTRLETGPVTAGGRELATTSPDVTTLVVDPGGPLRAGTALEVAVPWRLQVPGPVQDRISRDGDAMRLGSFFPILAWEPGVGWATDPAVSTFAEASTAQTADFDLTVTVPDGYSVLASGVADRPGHWTATAMRDVALSVGRFRTVTATARAPEPVAVTVGVHAGVAESAQLYVDQVVASLEDFGRRFGPYPWPAFTLAITPALAGGIEYPGHVMQGPGTSGSTTIHEVAHQWFYGLVGNNQGRDPWLDEGLATWGEVRFEGELEVLRAWPIPPAARNRVAEPMTYWAANRSAYYDGVYVQGAKAVAALGDADLVDCALRVYVAVNAHRIARSADLVRAAAAVFPAAARTLAGFGVRP